MRSYQIKMKNQSQKDKFKKVFNINWMQYTENFQIRENISVKMLSCGRNQSQKYLYNNFTKEKKITRQPSKYTNFCEKTN